MEIKGQVLSTLIGAAYIFIFNIRGYLFATTTWRRHCLTRPAAIRIALGNERQVLSGFDYAVESTNCLRKVEALLEPQHRVDDAERR